jgi:hypothetical protein
VTTRALNSQATCVMSLTPGQPTSCWLMRDTTPLLKARNQRVHSPSSITHSACTSGFLPYDNDTPTSSSPTNKACLPPPPSSLDLRHTKTPPQLVSHVPNRWIGAHSPVKMTLYYSLVSSLSPPTRLLSLPLPSTSSIHQTQQHIPCQANKQPS